MSARSGADRRRHHDLAVRASTFLVLAVGASLTGWWWADGTLESTSSVTNGLGVLVGAVALSVAAVVAGLRAHRRETGPATQEDLPSTHSPAEVGWLLRHGRVTLADLAATIVDLTARGFVLPYQRTDSIVLGQGRPADGLAAHEAMVLDWLFADWAREADLDDRRTTIAADPSVWSGLWDGFQEAVEEVGRSGGLVEREVASTEVLAAASTGLGILVAGVVGVAHGYPGWLVAVAAGALVLAGASTFARRSPVGEDLAQRWEAFGAHLRSGAPVTPHALAYAVTLGEGDVVSAHLAESRGHWPAQLVHDDVERRITGWREAYLVGTSVRGEPSERLRALLSLRSLRRDRPPQSAA